MFHFSFYLLFLGGTVYQLIVYIPETHLEQVKSALFRAGAGKMGNYDCCAWQTLGAGQFRPLQGSEPYLGECGELEKVTEYKVEMLCASNVIKEVLQVLIREHPYQTPAYHVYEVKTLDHF